jgi:hypothetical protein
MQTTLPIFSNKSFSDLLSEQELHQIEIVPNGRLKKSWKIEKCANHFVLSVPAKLGDAPTQTREALLTWSQIVINNKFSRKRLTAPKREILKECEAHIFAYLFPEKLSSKLRKIESPKLKFRDGSGVKFDLHSLFSSLNDSQFDNRLTSFLRWGQYGSKTSYHTTFLDEQNSEHHLITIAGLYNHPSIPQFAIESVMYHEMLHIHAPPIINKSRRTVHHKEFKALEKKFIHFEKWQNWLKNDAQKLIRRKRFWR